MGAERDELEDRVRAAYAERKPTPATSKSIVEDIAALEGLTTAKVRHILQHGGIGYVSHTKQSQVRADQGGDQIKAELSALRLDEIDEATFVKSRHILVRRLASELYYTQGAVIGFAMQNDVWPQTPSEVRNAKVTAAGLQRRNEEMAIAATREEELKEIARRSRDNPGSGQSGGGPDALGWIVIIVSSLAIATCVMNADPDSGKSGVQKKCERSLGPLGFDC